MQAWTGKKVVVIGAARQGLALARYLAEQGAQVVINDSRPATDFLSVQAGLAGLSGIEWVLGGHPLRVLDGADLVCPSGGVPLTLPLVVEAQQRGIPLSNDSQIFLEAAPCPVIGITGSAGKTTTTTLVGRMAEAAARETNQGLGRGAMRPVRAWVGGNIGNPLIAVLDEMQPEDLAVMELSSFQLESMTRSPQVAAVLNITPNHLDRHASMEAYTEAKARILAFQGGADAAVLNRDDPGAWALHPQVKGRLVSFGRDDRGASDPSDLAAFGRDDFIWLKDEKIVRRVMPRSTVRLRGEHNLMNVVAACAIAAAAGLPVSAMQAGVSGFTGVAHRLEFVRTYQGADWYNDSIATAPERSIAAIKSFTEPLVVLAGGRDKNLPWDEFARLALQRVDHLILFGEAAGKIGAAVAQARQELPGSACTVLQVAGLHQAVAAAAAVAEVGEVVLLAPGGTSFDEFRDFEERGEAFRQWVTELQ